jgi:hypothetical protein
MELKVGKYPSEHRTSLSMANYKKILGKDARFNVRTNGAALVKGNEGERGSL